MTRPALQHAYQQWEPPEDEPSAPIDDYREAWTGQMHIVRNPKRARLLRHRGVPLMDTGERTKTGKVVWAWFVEPTQGSAQDVADETHLSRSKQYPNKGRREAGRRLEREQLRLARAESAHLAACDDFDSMKREQEADAA